MARKGFTEDDRLWKEQILISVQIMSTWQFFLQKKDKKKNMYFSFRLRKASVS